MKFSIKAIEEKDPLVLEKEVFNQIIDKNVLPEETIIIVDNDKKIKMCDFIGYSSANMDKDKEENVEAIFKDNLNKKRIFKGKRPRK